MLHNRLLCQRLQPSFFLDGISALTAGAMVWSIIHIIWMNGVGGHLNYIVENGENGAKPSGSLSGVASIVVVPKRFVQLYM